jgi:hypothetical protein
VRRAHHAVAEREVLKLVGLEQRVAGDIVHGGLSDGHKSLLVLSVKKRT